ncbi:MAG: beta-propeller fold lactonase family protein [Alistipes sp.]|nr:beta-propeller fold lactonase family protein [Candidatus Minthomonas equi]
MRTIKFKQLLSDDEKIILGIHGRFAYLISELGDYVTAFEYSNGILKHLSTETAYEGNGRGSADIHVSPDNRYVYTSHRLKEDGIAIFRRNVNNGLLTHSGYVPTDRHPRNFAITPDGRLLLCACRDDNRNEIYSINCETGALTYTGKPIEIPAPVCIQFY